MGKHASGADFFFFNLYVKGEHNSKVVAHIGDEDFTVRINTDGEEYNIEVCLTVTGIFKKSLFPVGVSVSS